MLFLALAFLFVGRALYRDPHPDRLGFLQMGEAVVQGGWDENPSVNTYPPSFSLAMAPIARLRQATSDDAVRWLWGLAQLASLAYLTLASLAALEVTASLGLIAVAWLCIWRFVVGDLNSQNVTLFLEALAAAGVLRACRGQPRLGGALLGLGALLKVWPGFVVLGLVASRGRQALRVLAGFAMGLAGGAALTVLALGTGRVTHALEMWFGEVAPHFGGPELQDQAWKGMMLRLLGTDRGTLPETVALVWGVSLLAGLLAFLALRPARSTRVGALDAALVVVVGLPCFPCAWYFYEIALLPIVLAAGGSLAELAPNPRAKVRALLLVGTLLGGLLDRDLIGVRAWSLAAAAGNTLFGALAVVAAGLLVRESWRGADAAAALPAGSP